MKKIALICSAVLIAGCATAPAQQTRTQQIDIDKVAAVERAAHAVGVEVIWVNPPTRRIEN
jgi:uncharacterized lipoprotein YajG